jgi:Flp pilus assembly protein TadB
MQKNLFKPFAFTLLSILFFAHPLSISAAIFQKQMTQNPTTIFEKKREIKQSLFHRFIQKRIEKALKKQAKRNYEQEQPNQTIGLIALIFMFVGGILLLLTSGIGFLFIIIALILSIIGLIIEDNPIYARRTFWISLLITLYFLAKFFKVF